MIKFDQIILIGSTQLIYSIAQLLQSYYTEMKITIFNTEPSTMDKKTFKAITGKKKDLVHMLESVNIPTVVLSVNNKYILPESVISNARLVLINLHHGLLPAHPGWQAGTWAIYEGDHEAGITWHYITSGVDEGSIICQKAVEIGESTTSISLQRQCGQLALETLGSMLPLEDLNPDEAIKQDILPERKPHLFSQVPNDGYLDLQWSIDRMIRFLRAMDFGILKVMGTPKVHVEDRKFLIKRYFVSEVDWIEGMEVQIIAKEDKIIIKGEKRQIELDLCDETTVR